MAAVEALLPHVAKDLASAADRSEDDAARRALANAAALLEGDRDARAERAVAVFDELHAKALQDGRFDAGSDEGSHGSVGAGGFGTLSEAELSEQVIAQDLAAAARDSIEEDYPYKAYLDRLGALLGEPVDDDDGSALSAKGLAMAIAATLRPFTWDPLVRDPLTAAVLRHAARPLRRIVASIDEQLIESGLVGTRGASDGVVAKKRSAGLASGAEVASTAGVAPRASTPVRRAVSSTASVAVAGGVEAGNGGKPASQRASTQASEARAPADQATQPRPRGTTDVALAPAARSAPEGAPAPAAVGAEVVSRTVDDLIQGARSAAVLGRHPIAGKARAVGGIRQARLLPSIESIEKDAIAYAHQAGVAPFSAAARRSFFQQLRSQMRDAQVESAQLVVVDLVAAMFDYASDDARIPDPVKPLLWRLQLPTVTLACLDPGYLSEDDRSMRSLVEHVAAISIAYPEEVARESELHKRLQTLVRAAEVVAHAFQVRSRVLSDRVDIEYQRATYGMGQLVSRVSRERRELDATAGRRNRRDYRKRPSREREMQVTQLIDGLISQRLEGRKVPDSVREFLKDVWVRHLRTAVLRDGEESPGFKVALSVVDDLLWTIDGAGHRRSRSELADKIPTILGVLTQGIADIGAKADDYRPFFDEMFLIHLRRMQKRRSGKPTPAGLDDVASRPSSVPASDGAAETRRPGEAADAQTIPRLDDSIEMIDLDAPRSSRAGIPAKSLGARAAAQAAGAPPSGEAASVESSGSSEVSATAATAAATPAAAAGAVAATAAAEPAEAPPAASSAPADDAERQARAQTESENRLRKLLDETSLDDAPAKPVRQKLAAGEFERDLKVGDWLELVTSTRKVILAKVAWINERRSVVLLLQHPDRLILSRHLSALADRATRGRAFRVR